MPSLRPHNAVPCSSLDSYRRFLPCEVIEKRPTGWDTIYMLLQFFFITVFMTFLVVGFNVPVLLSFYIGYHHNGVSWTKLYLFNNFAQFLWPQFLLTLTICHLSLPLQGMDKRFRMMFSFNTHPHTPPCPFLLYVLTVHSILKNTTKGVSPFLFLDTCAKEVLVFGFEVTISPFFPFRMFNTPRFSPFFLFVVPFFSPHQE